jgi:hypothetical protein
MPKYTQELKQSEDSFEKAVSLVRHTQASCGPCLRPRNLNGFSLLVETELKHTCECEALGPTYVGPHDEELAQA